nr:hypothetical protein [Listeria monocytogenes]
MTRKTNAFQIFRIHSFIPTYRRISIYNVMNYDRLRDDTIT